MKKLRAIVNTILLTAAISISAQTVNQSIKFDEKIHDFGVIEETGGKVTHKFRFTNVGKEPVVILNARAGCSCVHADVPKRPVKPGESGYVTVSYDPDYRPGHFSKEIVVNSAEKQYNRIWVKGDVKPGHHSAKDNYKYHIGHNIYMNYKVINFGKVAAGKTVKKELRFGSDCDIQANLDFEVDNPGSGVSVPTGYILRPHTEGAVEIVVNPSKVMKKGTYKVTVTPVANKTYRLDPIEITYTIE